MKAGRFSEFLPVVYGIFLVLALISIFEWIDVIIWPQLTREQQDLHLNIFITFISCVAALFICKFLKAKSLIVSLVESSQDGIIGMNLDGTIISWNSGAERMLGYSFDAVKGKHMSVLLPPNIFDRTSQTLKEMRQGSRACQFESVRQKKNGESINVSVTVSPIKNAAGILVGASSILRDITAMKNMEDALRQARDCLHLEVQKRTAELQEANTQLRKEVQERLQAQKELEHERDKFMNILDSMEDRVYIANRDCDIEYANPAIEREYGPAKGRKCYEYLHDLRKVCAGCKQEEVFGGRSVRWVGTSDRDQKTYDFLDMPLRNADGSISRLQIFRDITEFKRVEQALRESEERYRTIFNKASDAIYVLGLTAEGDYGAFIEFNDNLPSMLGYTREELKDLSYSDVVAFESIDDSFRAKDKLIKEKHRLRERLFLTKQGEKIAVEVSSHLFDYKGQSMVLAIARNISERKRAEEMLRESEIQYRNLSQQFDALLKAIGDTLVLFSPDMKVLWRNNGPSQPPEAANVVSDGQCCGNVSFDASKTCKDCPVVRSFRSGKVETHLLVEGGSFFDKKAFPIMDGGQVSSVILLVSDITEKMNMQSESMQASHLASLGELAAGVAHEINNPINGIINYAQILVNEGVAESLEQDIGRRIVKEGERVADIVKSLLSFARGGRDDKWPTRVDAVLKESLLLTQTQLRQEGILIDISVADDLPEVEANFQQIQQVFINIINNARYALSEKYPSTHADKMMTIKVQVGDIDGSESVRTIFHDCGPGIPPDKLSMITRPFYSTKPLGKGTGLGLAVSQKIIADHGGRLAFESLEGEFTEVIVDLPVKGEK